MSVVHIKSTGTKSSGTSTADDWSDANCYPIASWTTALAATSAGDSVLFNDEAFTASNLSLNGAPTGLVTIGSRSGGTRLNQADATTGFFIYNSGTASSQIAFDSLQFHGNGNVWTTSGSAIMQFTQNCTAITFASCRWTGIRTASAARTTGLLFRMAGNQANSTVTITDCTVEDCEVDLTGDFQGLFKVEDNDITWTIDGLTFNNVRISCLGATASCLGFIYHTNTAPITLKNITATRCMVQADTAARDIGGIYRPTGSPGVVTIEGVTVNGFTMDGTASTEGLFKIIGAGTLRRATVTGLYRTGNTGGTLANSTGGLVLSTGSSADVTIEDINVSDSGGFYGTAFYNSGGGAIVAKNVTAKNISQNGQLSTGGDPVNGVAFYSGGSGATSWEGCRAYNCTGDTTLGTAWYCHLPATSSVDKTFTMRNCTFHGNQTDAGPAGMIRSLLALQTLNVTIQNCLFDNGSDEFDCDENTGTLNVTLTTTTNHITEGASAITSNISSGTLTLGTPTTGAPSINVSTGLPELAALATQGSKWWTGANPSGSDGEPLSTYEIPCGSVAFKDTNFHPSQL